MLSIPVQENNQPPYVTFEKKAVEDRAQTIEQGHWVGKDVDYACIMARGGKDRVEKPFDEWIKQQKQLAEEGRIPFQWIDAFENGYRRWKQGEEMLEDGTALKTWPAASPAQIRVCLSLGITTVEQLAHANTEALQRLGMQGHALKARAEKWLAESSDVGKAVLALEKATKANEALEARNRVLEERLAAMEAKLGVQSPAVKEAADQKAEFKI